MILPQVDQLVVQHDPDLRFMRFQWLDATRKRVRPALRHGRNLVRDYQPIHALVDLRGLPDLSIDDQLWMTGHWFPVVAAQALRQAALVLPTATHNQMAVESLLWVSRHLLRFEVQFFTDEVSALDWLLDSAEVAVALQQEWEYACQDQQAAPVFVAIAPPRLLA